MAKPKPEPKREAGDPDRERFALQVMAVLAGAGAVAALPLLAAIVAGQAPPQLQLIVFAFPLALAATGRLRDIRWWQQAAAAVAGLLVLAFVLSIGELALLFLAAGAVVSLIVVGKYLLDQDRIAGGAWLGATSIATIAGFLGIAAEVPGVAGAVGAVVVLGSAVALQRLRKLAA